MCLSFLFSLFVAFFFGTIFNESIIALFSENEARTAIKFIVEAHNVFGFNSLSRAFVFSGKLTRFRVNRGAEKENAANEKKEKLSTGFSNATQLHFIFG